MSRYRRFGNLATFVAVWLGVVVTAQALNIEHVSNQDIQELRQKFTAGHSPSDSELEALHGRTFTCQLYGVRSRLQVERNLKLYRFVKDGSSKELKNEGAQVVRNYVNSNKGLEGKSHSILDVIRFSGNGDLIAELSIPRDLSQKSGSMTLAALSDSTRQVLGYANCN